MQVARTFEGGATEAYDLSILRGSWLYFLRVLVKLYRLCDSVWSVSASVLRRYLRILELADRSILLRNIDVCDLWCPLARPGEYFYAPWTT